MMTLSCLPNQAQAQIVAMKQAEHILLRRPKKRRFAPDENIIVQYSVSTEESIADFSCFYAIKNEYGAFASPFSEDDARERYFDYAIASDIMSLEKF